MALLVLSAANRANAFFFDAATFILEVGKSITVKVKGSTTGAAVSLTSVSTPGFVQSDFLSGPRNGTGFVNVVLTGLSPGTGSAFFSGTNNGGFVSGSINIFVLGSPGTTAQSPFIGIGGDPVNTSTGEYFGTEAVDLNLGGPMPLIFARYVASKLSTDNLVQAAMGTNRSHNFASRIEATSATIKRVVLPSGRVLRFDKVGTKWNLVSPLDVPFILIESGTNFLLGHPHTKQIWTYDNTGKLTKIEDGKGNAHTLAYLGTKLSSVSDGLGRTINISQPGTTISSVSGVIGADTRQVTFTYTSGVLTSATDYGGHTTTYGNTGGRPTSVQRPMGNTLFTQIYDANNKVMSQTERGTDTSTLGYAPTTTTFTDPTLATLVDTYDTGGRQISYADEVGNAIAMTYDSAGRRNSVTDRLGDKTTTLFHALSGLPATITNAEGKSTGMTYKPRTLSGIIFQDVAKITYPDGASRSFTYDAKGNITQITDELGKIWKYTFNTNGQVLTATNPLLGVTTYTYNAAGNRATSQEPDEGTTIYAYDPARFRLTQITRPGGATVIIAYDTKDRITSITDERSKAVMYAYDNNDRLTTATDPDANNTTYAHDLLDRVLSSVDRRGKTSSMTYNSRHGVASTTDRNGNSTTYQYDARRRPVSTTDAGGQVWTQQFDLEGLLTGAADPVNPAGKIKRNHLGQPVEISDPLGNTSHLVRDAMQRVTLAFDPLGRQTTYAYDKRGLLISASEQGIGTAKYDRDALGNVSKITDPNANAWAYTFLKSGRLSTMTDPLGKKWTYVYDARGRLATITYPDATTCTFSYDAASNVTGRQYSGAGPNLVSTYDNLGRLATADGLTFSYDAEGNLTNAVQNGQDFTATYDDGGRLTSVSYMGSGITVNYEYDSRNRLTKVTDTKSSTILVFSYDNAGRPTGMTRTPGIDALFNYDAAGRLTQIDEAAVLDLQYTLTPVGEVAGVDFTAPLVPAVAAATQSFLFGKAGQITTPGYLYDLRGRLTVAPGDTFAWDGASRLINADGVTLAYNGLGDVTTRTVGVDVTRFYNHYALGMAPIVYEDPPTGNDRAYVWTPGGRLLYSVDMGTGEPTFYHFDRIGSTLALTDSTGTVIDAYAYGPYGEPLGHTGTSTQPFQYIGAYGVRAEGTLYQMRARYYDPKTARFLSRDPVPARAGDVKSSNPYQYAAQNPMRYVDPMGTRESPTPYFSNEYWNNGDWMGDQGGDASIWWDFSLGGQSKSNSRAPHSSFGGTSCASCHLGESSTWGGFNALPPICKPDGPGTGGNDLFGNPNAGGSSFPPAPNPGSSGDDTFISSTFGVIKLNDIIDDISGQAQGGNAFDRIEADTINSFLQSIDSPSDNLGYTGASPGTLAKDYISGINTGAPPAAPPAPKPRTPGRHSAALDALIGPNSSSASGDLLDLRGRNISAP